MGAPEEIIVSPFEVWFAELADTLAFPDIDADPVGETWTKLGTSGKLSMAEDGVSIQHSQSIEEVRTYGSTGPVKAVRTSEDLIVTFTLYDLTIEAYAQLLNFGKVTTTAATVGKAGDKAVPILRGTELTLRAWLIRGPSAHLADHNMQYEIPMAYVAGSPTVAYSKGSPAGLEFELHALEDVAGTTPKGFGTIRAAHAAALPVG